MTTDLTPVPNIPILGSGTDVAHSRSPSDPEFGARTYTSDPDGAYLRRGNEVLRNLGQIVVGNGPP